MTEREIFIAALKEGDPGQRAALLDQACGGDQRLRVRLEELLREQQQLGSFLEVQPEAREGNGMGPSPLGPETTVGFAEKPGVLIGPYKLLEQIGEGGMGLVYVAEQEQPIKRRVALKIIKPGMDTKQVIARFEAERQALALMDHPHIAKVHDAGTTAEGRPYFVMELVRGRPITEYCDQHRLTTRQRLELFLDVCQAVQHAHQKGIIHRDLKPSNVLVSLHDTTPVVKVIDFGIAKATGGRLTDHTLYTAFAQMVGTPLYMSPEQAGLSDLDVDTRSDVYSLGVLLYELLTGTTPFDQARFRQAGYDEVRRIIREEEPPKPSTRISTLGQAAATVSMQRQMEPRQLRRLMRGELDWIVMKALEKDRNHRYETANALAADVQRYLRDEPVQACPPSGWYRLRKLARRHKVALAMANILAAALLLGVAGLVLATYRIAHERDLARWEHQQAEANLQKARMAVDDYLTTVSENRLLKSSLPGLQPLRKELLQTALRYYQGFVHDHADDPTLRFDLATATFRVGVITAEIDSRDKGLRYLHQARDLLQQLADAEPAREEYRKELGRCLIHMGYVLTNGKTHDAVLPFEQGIGILETIANDNPTDDRLLSDLAFGCHYLGFTFLELGKCPEAESQTRRAIELRQKLAGRNSSNLRYRSDLVLSTINLSNIQLQESQPGKALQTVRQAQAIERDLVREHPRDAAMCGTLALSVAGQAVILRSMGHLEESLPSYRESSKIMHQVAEDNPLDLNLQGQAALRLADYAQALVDSNRLVEAEQALAQAQAHVEVVLRENPNDSRGMHALSGIYRNRGKIFGKNGKFDDALRELLKSVKIDERFASERAMSRYDLACSLALCFGMAKRMGAAGDAERYAQRGLTELRRAAEQGWNDTNLMQSDPDLDALRSRADFQAFMRSLPARSGQSKP